LFDEFVRVPISVSAFREIGLGLRKNDENGETKMIWRGESKEMARQNPEQYNGSRYSVRAAITVWMVLAGFIWLALGVVLTYATRWGGDTIEAEGKRLSTIVPAAGPQANPAPDAAAPPAKTP
jgi:hypothetical protein